LVSSPIESVFADCALFFQHQKKEDDFESHPDWAIYSKALMKKQLKMKYPNADPDLEYIDGCL
jgi:hypothetical protein